MVTVYVPNQCKPDTPFIVGADGPDRMLFSALDTLIADGRIPSMVAISVSNGGGEDVIFWLIFCLCFSLMF